MKGCKHTCLHYQFVRDYQMERERQYTEAEELSGGHEPEMTDALSKIINFHTYLGRGPRDARSQ